MGGGNVLPIPPSADPPDAKSILNALATAVLVLDENLSIRGANGSAEDLFDAGTSHLMTKRLHDFLPPDSPVFSLIGQALETDSAFSEHGISLDTPRTGKRSVTIHVSPLVDRKGWVVLSLHEHSIAIKIGDQLTHRNAARSVTAMASMLAHEIKNPLSGIRGAAQILEQGVSDEDRPLTHLIRDETDRIVALVDRMEVFSDPLPAENKAVNIHRVLEHVRRLAENGFGKGLRYVEKYDPSLPPVLGNRDHLVQVFLNLVKNAAEAVMSGSDGGGAGEIIFSTAYRQGVRLAVPGAHTRMNLPMEITIEDNGPGIPEDMKPYLFDPFVTNKPKGSGLGLALVAKMIDDHGGLIEFDSRPGKTVFRIMLPFAPPETPSEET